MNEKENELKSSLHHKKKPVALLLTGFDGKSDACAT
jgi:hypothetical protein